MRRNPEQGRALLSRHDQVSDWLIRSVILMLAWLILWRVSVLMEYAPHASIWFPPAGLSFAAFLIMGLRAFPAIFLVGVIATFWVDALYASNDPFRTVLWAGILFGLGHSLAYWLGAHVLKVMVVRSASDALPSIILSFLVLGSTASLLAALLGTQALAHAGAISFEEAGNIWVPWWIGDMAGTIALAPLFIALLSWRYRRIEPWLGGLSFQPSGTAINVFLLKLGVFAGLLLLAMLLARQSDHPEVAFAVFFLIIPQMWITYTESAIRAAISLALFCTLTAIGVALLDLMEYAMVYQFAVTVIAASTYFGLAVPVLVGHNRMLREEAITDGLTRISSRRFFFEQAGYQLLRSRRLREPVSLIVFDLDHFKDINDRYGHIAGDNALLGVATVVRDCLRHNDLFGRFGGDEFMLLLPGCGANAAEAKAQELRQAINGKIVPAVSEPISASFSVVEVEPEEPLMAAFGRADEQLLLAKREGRNRVVTESAVAGSS